MSTSMPLHVLARRSAVTSIGSKLPTRAYNALYSSSVVVPRLRCSAALNAPITHLASRAFSTTRPRCFASVEESFDPKTVERESDEVDVCIVGGGEHALVDLPQCALNPCYIADHVGPY